VFDAPELDMANDFEVEWRGGPGEPLQLAVNTDDSHVTLLHNGGTEYELHFDGAKVQGTGLIVASGADKPKGNRRFDPLPFRLMSGARGENGRVQAGQEVRITPKSDEAEVQQDPRLLIFEIKDFHGDMSTFLCHLLSREVRLEEDDSVTVSFAMEQTNVWLTGDVRGGTGGTIVTATFTVYNAADKASNLKVEIEGVGPVSETTGQQPSPGAPTLTQRFDGLNLVFELNYPVPSDKRPADDYVTFVYSIGGAQEQRDRVKHSLAKPE
jgi:hypothetical protein